MADVTKSMYEQYKEDNGKTPNKDELYDYIKSYQNQKDLSDTMEEHQPAYKAPEKDYGILGKPFDATDTNIPDFKQIDALKQNEQTLGLAPQIGSPSLHSYSPKLGNLVADDNPVGVALNTPDSNNTNKLTEQEASDAADDAIKQYGGDASNSRQAVAKVADQEQAARTPEQNAAFDKAKEAALNPAAQDTEFEQAKQEANDRAMLAGVIKAIGQVTQGATTLGAGQQTNIDTTQADQMIKNANLPVEQLEKGRQLLAEKLKNASAAALQNANSKESIVARAIAKKIGMPGIDNTTTAEAINTQMKSYEVYQAKQAMVQQHKDAAEANAIAKESLKQSKLSASDEKQQSAIGKDLDATTASVRTQLGQQASIMSKGIHALNMINSEKDPNKVNPQQLAEASVALAVMVKGGAITETDKHELMMNPLSAKAAKLVQDTFGNIQGAGAAEQVKFLQHAMQRQIDTAKQIAKPHYDLVEEKNAEWISRHPEQWQKLKSKGLATAGIEDLDTSVKSNISSDVQDYYNQHKNIFHSPEEAQAYLQKKGLIK